MRRRYDAGAYSARTCEGRGVGGPVENGLRVDGQDDHSQRRNGDPGGRCDVPAAHDVDVRRHTADRRAVRRLAVAAEHDRGNPEVVGQTDDRVDGGDDGQPGDVAVHGGTKHDDLGE